jgi:hypothetical protein
MMGARPRSSLGPLGPRPPRSLRVDDRDQRAERTRNPFDANSLCDLVASLRTVVVPASLVTFANRAVLRAIGLGWDSVGHRWHGTTTGGQVRELRERLGLEVRVFGQLEAIPKGPAAPKPSPPTSPDMKLERLGGCLRGVRAWQRGCGYGVLLLPP